MKRKRALKLMMALGISRNQANSTLKANRTGYGFTNYELVFGITDFINHIHNYRGRAEMYDDIEVNFDDVEVDFYDTE